MWVTVHEPQTIVMYLFSVKEPQTTAIACAAHASCASVSFSSIDEHGEPDPFGEHGDSGGVLREGEGFGEAPHQAGGSSFFFWGGVPLVWWV